MKSFKKMADAIRFLSMDAIQKANSGHPGAPMGMADIAAVVWGEHLAVNPANPKFVNRDRFILSNGHASMLNYSLLHLTGFDISIDDLKNFRQMGSKTPGHPEVHITPGVETTTGPLGQGFANAVGMALAEKILASEFNEDGHEIVDHMTWVFIGDGCLMEGISHEAASLAGTWGLGKLVAIYDDNNISIDGTVEGWFTEDVAQRFQSYGWHVQGPIDGHDYDAIEKAVEAAKAEKSKPSMIICKTKIGKGAATKEGSEKTHGSPLGDEEIQKTREALGWTLPPFEVPKEVYDDFSKKASGAELEKAWNDKFAAYKAKFPQKAAEFERRMRGDLPANYEDEYLKALDEIIAKGETVATRKASQQCIQIMANILPELVGGSADLTPSNLTNWKEAKSFNGKDGGNYIHYGVREFGMAAIVNGMALHGGVRPFGSTFLMFSEYARNALRMAALMEINPFFVFTHDSIGLGEDGPTHQPLEQTATLRLIPNMDVWRPCDTFETLVAYDSVIKSKTRPSCLVLSRQNLPYIKRSSVAVKDAHRGGYVLEGDENPEIVIIATGSEVEIAMGVREKLQHKGYRSRVVSMPSTTVFDREASDYKEFVLPRHAKKLAIEAGVGDVWWKYVGLDGEVVSIDHFCESAPAGELFKKVGFTVKEVADKAIALLER